MGDIKNTLPKVKKINIKFWDNKMEEKTINTKKIIPTKLNGCVFAYGINPLDSIRKHAEFYHKKGYKIFDLYDSINNESINYWKSRGYNIKIYHPFLKEDNINFNNIKEVIHFFMLEPKRLKEIISLTRSMHKYILNKYYPISVKNNKNKYYPINFKKEIKDKKTIFILSLEKVSLRMKPIILTYILSELSNIYHLPNPLNSKSIVLMKDLGHLFSLEQFDINIKYFKSVLLSICRLSRVGLYAMLDFQNDYFKEFNGCMDSMIVSKMTNFNKDELLTGFRKDGIISITQMRDIDFLKDNEYYFYHNYRFKKIKDG